MRYRCDDCGHVFDEPYLYEEPDVGYAAMWCPECHSDDIVEVQECKLCDELTPAHLLTSDGYCPECVRRTREKFNAFLEKYFEKEELEILKDQWIIEPID